MTGHRAHGAESAIARSEARAGLAALKGAHVDTSDIGGRLQQRSCGMGSVDR